MSVPVRSYDAENQQEDVNGSDCMIASLHCQRLQGVGQVQHGIQPNQPRRIRMTARNSQEVTRAPYQSADPVKRRRSGTRVISLSLQDDFR